MSAAASLAALGADVEKITKGFKIAAEFDFKGFIEAFKSQSTQQKIAAGADAIETALEIAGLFFPPAAVAANDLRDAEEAIAIIGPLLAGAFHNLIPVEGGAGGFVTQDWADDPRNQLNPDGSFKY